MDMNATVSHIKAEISKSGSATGYWDTIEDINRAKDAFAFAGICVTVLTQSRSGGHFVIYTAKGIDDEALGAKIAQKREALKKI